MSVKIDKSKWSISSRRSSEYTGQFLNADYYSEGIAYRCNKCFRNCVFTPEEQKVAFEDDKKIIHYVPSLCSECTAKYKELTALVSHCQIAWNRDRESLAADRKFISNWLQAIREKNSYGKRVDIDREKMLSKLLREMPYEWPA